MGETAIKTDVKLAFGWGLAAPEAGDLALEVQGHDHAAAVVLAPLLSGDEPHDLELVAVGVGGVERFGGAVVAAAGEGAEVREREGVVRVFARDVAPPVSQRLSEVPFGLLEPAGPPVDRGDVVE